MEEVELGATTTAAAAPGRQRWRKESELGAAAQQKHSGARKKVPQPAECICVLMSTPVETDSRALYSLCLTYIQLFTPFRAMTLNLKDG